MEGPVLVFLACGLLAARNFFGQCIPSGSPRGMRVVNADDVSWTLVERVERQEKQCHTVFQVHVCVQSDPMM